MHSRHCARDDVSTQLRCRITPRFGVASSEIVVASLTLVLAASCGPSTAPAAATRPTADIAALASPTFAGRYPGTAGGDSAVAFLVQRYAALHLQPAFHAACDSAVACPSSYVQPFPFEQAFAQNVGVIINGTDSTLRTQYIVIGAHFDALGRSRTHALDPWQIFAFRPGADDNGSGTAGVLELARRFAAMPIRRSILVVNFDAEEEGLLGSRAFVANPPVPISAIVLMLNFDMIGRLRRGRVVVEVVPARSELGGVVARAAAERGLRADFISDRKLSDHASFAARSIDVVSLSSGDHLDYHTISDVAARINAAGLARVIDFAEALIRQRDAR